MLRQSAVARRKIIASLSTPRASIRHLPTLKRRISFLPWRKAPPPPRPGLPVYFPRARLLPPRDVIRRKLLYWTFSAVVVYFCLNVYLAIVIDPFFDWLDEELVDEEDEADAEGEEDYEFVGYFLPFPWGIKEVQEPPYKGSDPEWARFVQVNRDKKLQKSIRLELARALQVSAERNPEVVRRLGGKKTEIKKVWLDIIYPPSPPPSYHIPGLSIHFDEGISWSSVPVNASVAGQLTTALYPKAVALSVWSFFNTLISHTAQDAAEALRSKDSSPPTGVSWQSAAIDKMKARGDMGASGNVDIKAQAPSTTEDVKITNLGVQAKNSNSIGDPATGNGIPISPRVQAAMSAAAMAFKKNWRPTKQFPHRGCIRVDGLVEIQGKNAIMAVYAVGWYDPEHRKFVAVQTVIKHILPLQQRPAVK